MFATLRRCATISSGRSLRSKGPPMSLEQFLQRKKVMDLWREIVRATNKIPPSSTREEMKTFAREEFERFRHVEDLGHIRYLVSTGKTQLDAMRRYVEQNGM
ncbi:unnamed protein product [Zymoseptoria tritici ST99CH_1A5]|uniref:LYR motif-containing protein 2 n=2 Tax=Zymoseptoria TaxID=1047167 RepID=A0A0F4GR43_9PEZI|nr:LYR motif-containing protein 2 [Zymoseptoria brevis]SMR53766.1 unnamed protein product [Zymoseptoria tritici ST99CH_3D1]SMY24353.1 unnamed protein product [Zymoseptoria tritici ST99CH_1A5]